MSHSIKISTLFAWLFLSTGVFAVAGALSTWGEGWLFFQTNLEKSLIPWADLLVTGPLSLMAAYGIWKQKNWGIVIGSVTSGIYLFGSALVYIKVFGEGAPYPWKLVVPPIFGVIIALSFIIWAIKNNKKLFLKIYSFDSRS